MTSRPLIAVFALSAAFGFDVPSRYTLKERIERADTIVVASLERSIPMPAGAAIGEPRTPPGFRVYPCAIDLEVQAVLTGSVDHKVERVTVFSYLRNASCTVRLMGRAVPGGHSLIWLLRRQGRLLRTWTDDYETMIWLTSFGPAARQGMDQFKDPALAVAYLILAPGIGLPVASYNANVSWMVSGVLEMVGFADFWRLLAAIYTRSPPPGQELICLLASESGACLGCARAAAARGVEPGPDADENHSLMRPDQFRVFEHNMLREMDPAALARSRTSVVKTKWLREDLFWSACTSSRALRTRSRRLLHTLFGVDPRAISCIPCESSN